MSESLADYAKQRIQDENMSDANQAIESAKNAMMDPLMKGIKQGLRLDVTLAVLRAQGEENGTPREVIYLFESWVREAYEKAEKE